MKKLIYLFLIIIAFASCGKKQETVIASVDDENLSAEDLMRNFSVESPEELTDKQVQDYIQDWIKITLLANEADESGLSEELELKQEFAVKKIKANAVIAQKLATAQISEEELFSYYKLHKSKFKTKNKEYKVQRIFVKNENKLQDVISSLNDGMNFKEAAKLFSEEASAENGGYAGFVNEKNSEKKVWETLNSLKKWYYKSVEISNGFYVIRHYEIRTVETEKTFVEVKDEIEIIVRRNKKEELFNELLEDLKANAEISVSN
jgi:peptidyl-prolyl cis-trans isomerase C